MVDLFITYMWHWRPPDIVVIFAFSCQIYFKELRWRIITYIYPDIYHFCCSSLILDTLSLFLNNFPSLWWTSFCYSIWAGLLAKFLFSVPSSENVFISPSFLMDIFVEYRISFFSILKMVQFLMNPMVFNDKCAFIVIITCLYVTYPLVSFKIFLC